AEGAGLAAAGEAAGGAVPQHEHQQAVIVPDPRADELAVIVDRLFHAVDRAVHRDILDPLDADVERGLPGAAEFVGLRVAAQIVGAVVGTADAAAGGLDRAGFGQRLDEGALDCGLPAVGAVALARDRGEIGNGGGECGVVFHGRANPTAGRFANPAI